MKKVFFIATALVFMFAGCSEDIIDDDLMIDDVMSDATLKSYDSGTHDGYFWQLWTDDHSGWIDYQNGPGGNYSVSWDYNGNFTCGKGWSSGSKTRIIGYNIGVHNHSGGGVFGYYGWSRSPMIEYYVNESWGTQRPTYGRFLGTVNSDGSTYDIYEDIRVNAPSIEGTQTFTQIYSTRRSKVPVGQNRTITFANHVNAWANLGYHLNDMSPYAILLTEAYGGNSQGSVNATVWSAGEGSGDGGNTDGGGATYYRIQNRATGLFLDGMGRTSDGSDLGQYANTNHQNAQWTREASGGFERFRNRGTGLYIDGMGRTENGANVGQWANTNHNNAQWSLESAGNGYYRLRNRGTGLYLDGMGRTSDGSNVGQWANTNHNNSHWRFVPVQ
ncbi:glycoside hydrolase family 11 protein [Natronoflexus pectinivorans]|uniref:Endo-1,4-beta-xylanase n=1 Tax=Natronoflexus pectinivorans TaxID=682526 RepID=A0A4V2RWY2_9BACT|nr:glycoside hydrolase family 11 protein [Natronoflexus pectinivorans]TCO10691.1 endo-1,4-beta-xylanase [Natronoflexus pectinivorans]